ncbi:MAG: hypothetical protein ACYC5Q_05340 [Thermoleophilia bacterium]
MQGPWDLTSTTGDQCTLCGEPLEDGGTTIEADGAKFLQLCGSCAAERAADTAADTAEKADASDETAAGKARTLLHTMIEERAREHAFLGDLTGLIDRLDDELARSQMSALALEERIHTLETELDRTREQLRRVEDLLATSQSTAPALAMDGGDHTPAQSSEQTPDVVVSVTELTGEDVRMSQRLFNESPFTEKTRGVRRSLGRPIVNLARVTGGGRKTLLTVAWDIVWYQYLLDLSPEPEDVPVDLFAEGLELSELSAPFKEANGIIDDQGRFDASELELSLERDHPAHLAAREDEGDQAMDDATEEIWGKASMPEFRWDD